MVDDLLEIKDGEVTINRASILFTKTVRDIMKRDRGGTFKGDTEGRQKELGRREVGYGWWVVNINSPGVTGGYEKEELLRHAIDNLNLPDTWKPDALVLKWVEEYRAYHEGSATVRAIKNLIQGFVNMDSINEKLMESIKIKIGASTTEEISTLINLQKTLMGQVADMPKMVKDLNTLYVEARRVEKNTTLGKGNVTITSSMEPDID